MLLSREGGGQAEGGRAPHLVLAVEDHRELSVGEAEPEGLGITVVLHHGRRVAVARVVQLGDYHAVTQLRPRAALAQPHLRTSHAGRTRCMHACMCMHVHVHV